MAGLSTASTTVVGSAEITNNSIVNEDINTAAAIDATKIADGTVTSAEFQYINTLTSNAQTQLTTNATAISDHLADATDAHDASAISSVAAGNLAATDVQGALNELQSDIDTRATATSVSDHIGDTTAVHAASAISFSAVGTIAATDAQTAIAEVATDAASALSTHESDTSTHGVATVAGLSEVQVFTNKSLSDSTTSIVDVADATKKILFDAGGTTATTTTITAAQTANRVVTLPDATDTLIGKATADTLTNKTFDADGAGNSISNIENADIKAAAAIALNKLAAATASRALVSDASGFVTAATTTSTEIGYVNGVTSAIQTQLNTAAPMTTGGDIIYGGASGVPTRLANGSAGQFLKSAGSTNAPVWAAASQGDVQAKTTTYTALVTDGYINCSGSAFTVTLFAASGNSGKTLTITKTDSSLTNIITIDGNASETIDGATTTTLNTQYESVTLYCDGSNWFIQQRKIAKVWASYSGTITGTTIGGSITYTANTLYWAREGSNVRVHGNIRLNVVTTAPTGTIYINLPTSVAWAAVADDSDGGRGPWGSTSCRVASALAPINFITLGAPNTNSVSMAPGSGTIGTFANGDEVKVDLTIPVEGWNG